MEQNPRHSISESVVSGESLGSLLALDYGRRPLSELVRDSVRLPGEPLSHGLRLEESLNRSGMAERLILVQRLDGPTLLVEGHHRGVWAYRERQPAPIALHHCACPPIMLDFFGLCPEVHRACSELNARAQAEGWAWKEEEV